MVHEALVLLFRNRPSLAAEVMRDVLRVPLPAFDEARVESAELTEMAPAEYRADLVVRIGGAATDAAAAPVQARAVIVVEAQLSPDAEKRWSWPAYLASLRRRWRCPSYLLVVCVDADVAAWCARPIELGQSVLVPTVLGPDAVPLVTDAAQARRVPELAVLSALAHGRGPRADEVALAACDAAATLDEDRSVLYHDLVLTALSAAARTRLEAIMASGTYEFQSDFAKRHRAQGKVEGKAEGKAEGKVEAILAVLAARDIALGGDGEARVRACVELAQLDAWLCRAVTVTSAAELFA